MATIRTGLAMYDQMTSVLKGITSSLHLTLSAMEDLQNSTDKTFDNKKVNAARSAIQQTEAAMKMLPPPIEEAVREQKKLNSYIVEGTKNTGAFVKQIAGIATAYLSVKKVKDVFSDLVGIGFEFKSHMQSSEIAFTTMLGSAEKAKEFLDELYAFNMTTPFSFPDWVTGSRQLIAFGMDEGNVIPTLSAIGDVIGGIGGGSAELLQLTEAFGAIQVAGRLTMNEVNRLQTSGIPALRILSNQMEMTTEQTRKMISSGALEATHAIGMLVDGIKHGTDGIVGVTPTFDGMMANVKQTWTGAIGSMMAAWRDAGGKFVEPFLEPATKAIRYITAMFRRMPEALAPISQDIGKIFNTINQGFENNSFDFFLNTFLGGIRILTSATAWGVEFMVEHLEIVKMTLVTIGVVLTALAAKWIITWVVAAWPVFAVIGAIALLMTILNRLGVTADQVIGFIGGVFFTLFATIKNQIALFWNLILSVAEFFGNIFIDPVYAIKKLFYDMVKNVSEYFTNMINSVLKGLNWLIEKVNSVAGTSINVMAEWSNDWVEDIKPETNKDVFDLSKYMMQQTNLGDAFQKGYQSGASFAGGIVETLNGANMPGYDMSKEGSMMPTDIDKVGEVGKIRDTVDISSEDLKMMRELAEMQNIQNFVTLTPQLTFGDTHVKQDGRSIEEIIANITAKLEEEITSSTEGLYDV